MSSCAELMNHPCGQNLAYLNCVPSQPGSNPSRYTARQNLFAGDVGMTLPLSLAELIQSSNKGDIFKTIT